MYRKICCWVFLLLTGFSLPVLATTPDYFLLFETLFVLDSDLLGMLLQSEPHSYCIIELDADSDATLALSQRAGQYCLVMVKTQRGESIPFSGNLYLAGIRFFRLDDTTVQPPADRSAFIAIPGIEENSSEKRFRVPADQQPEVVVRFKPAAGHSGDFIIFYDENTQTKDLRIEMDLVFQKEKRMPTLYDASPWPGSTKLPLFIRPPQQPMQLYMVGGDDPDKPPWWFWSYLYNRLCGWKCVRVPLHDDFSDLFDPGFNPISIKSMTADSESIKTDISPLFAPITEQAVVSEQPHMQPDAHPVSQNPAPSLQAENQDLTPANSATELNPLHSGVSFSSPPSSPTESISISGGLNCCPTYNIYPYHYHALPTESDHHSASPQAEQIEASTQTTDDGSVSISSVLTHPPLDTTITSSLQTETPSPQDLEDSSAFSTTSSPLLPPIPEPLTLVQEGDYIQLNNQGAEDQNEGYIDASTLTIPLTPGSSLESMSYSFPEDSGYSHNFDSPPPND